MDPLSLDPNAVAAIAVSPFVGSFLATVIVRLPSKERWAVGRSRCPACRHGLGLRDLVPLLSWVATRGRCRHCGAPIGGLYPVIELAALIVAVWVASLMEGWILWASCGLGWTLLVLAAIDQRHFVLPNSLTLPLAAAGLAIAAAIDLAMLPAHGIGAVGGFAAFALIAWLYKRLRGREGLGMGDAKLATVAGAWTSWVGLPGVVLWACVGAFTLALVQSVRGRALSLQSRIAFGPHLCLGIWLVWLYGPFEVASFG